MTHRRSELKFGLLLLGAFAVRAVAAWFSLGADHPNETYRLLEPLAAASGYAVRLPWEWTDGLLSVLPVQVLHAWVTGPLEALGASALFELHALKLIYASLSLLPVWATWRLLKTRAGIAQAWIGAAFVAFWPEFIYRSARLMDYTPEAALLAVAATLVIASPLRSRKISLVGAGLVLGLAFFVRFQSGLYFVALLAGLFASDSESVDTAPLISPVKAAISEAVMLTIAYGLTVAVLALYEMHLTSAPFLSPFARYVRFNWFEDGAARMYGTAPWHRYLSESLKAYGFLPFFLLLVGALCAARRGGRKLALLFFLPFLAFTCLAHKEGRFIYGFLWVLVPLALSSPLFPPSKRWIRGAWVAALLIGFGLNAERVCRRWLAGTEDVKQWAELGQARQPFGVFVIHADPDGVPGGFFLRHRGSFCYEYEKDLSPRRQGQCEGSEKPAAQILKNAQSGRWELVSPPN